MDQYDGITHEYVRKRASLLFFVLSSDGRILEANAHAKLLTGQNLTPLMFEDIILDFNQKFSLGDVSQDGTKEYLLNINTRFGLPQSYYFVFFSMPADKILVYGRLDTEELENMRKEVLTLNNELNTLVRELQKKNSELKRALAEIKTLRGILPICGHCKKIRDDKGYWNQAEAYIQKHSDASLSHSICPECAEKYYPDLDIYDEN